MTRLTQFFEGIKEIIEPKIHQWHKNVINFINAIGEGKTRKNDKQ